MWGLLAVLVVVAVMGAIAYRGARLWVWSLCAVLLTPALALAGLVDGASAAVVSALVVPPLVVLNTPALRRRLITGRALAVFRRVLPPVSDTEREALAAGDTWWETDLFRGRPDWTRLLATPITRLSPEERSFLDNQVETLCAMLDEDRIERVEHDLPPAVWDYLRREGFFGLIIPRSHGGLGFSSLAQSTIVERVASRSLSAAVTVMVPNSLGPGELLLKYGTEAQQAHWLPRLADGREIPCFALTGPDVGSDASAMPDRGVVVRGQHAGRETLGVRLSFSKRYITLAPVATVVGLAFRLEDPDGLLGDDPEPGITCALLPSNHPGVRIGERHYPMGLAFQNGPISGEDVFIPVDWIIGGPAMAGRGWRMLMECLSVGRAISLPALGTAATRLAYRTTGAYARIRRQFRLPIGRFEGVQEAMARIAGAAYTLEAARRLTASAGDLGVRPSVVSAIAKYHMTERMRGAVNDAMDIHGGRGIIFGPRNYLGYAYQATPVAITVEGANILTRSLMIFGQGAIRCHPYVFAEMETVQADDEAAFDRLFTAHAGYTVNRAVRALVLGVTGARLVRAPVRDATARHYRELTRMSTALAVVGDAAMAVLGGDLKRRERLSARLGDVLSQLYLASAVLKYHADAGRPADEKPYVDWAVGHALAEIQRTFDGFFDNFPNRAVARVLRRLVFPLGRSYRPPSDALGTALAESMMTPGGVRDRLTGDLRGAAAPDDVTGRLECAFDRLVACEGDYDRLLRAVARGEVTGSDFATRLRDAEAKGVVDAEAAAGIAAFEALRYEAILTDAFPPEAISPGASARERVA